MATATSSTSSSSPAASSGQSADDNNASSFSVDGGADPQDGDNLPGDPPAASQPPASATPASDIGTDDSRSADPLKAERRKNNQLEKEIRTLRQQLNRFSEINPEEYSRIQEAERQKQVLEERMELRERRMEEASAQRVAAVAAERNEAKQQVLQLRKDGHHRTSSWRVASQKRRPSTANAEGIKHMALAWPRGDPVHGVSPPPFFTDIKFMV